MTCHYDSSITAREGVCWHTKYIDLLQFIFIWTDHETRKQEPDFLCCSSCFFSISHTISISMSSAIKWRLVPIYLSRRSTQCKYISRRSYTVQVYILLRSQSSPLQICPAICPCAWRIHGLEVALDGFTIQFVVSVVVNGAALCRNQAQDGSTMFTLSALCLTCLWPALNSGDNVVERHMGEWKWPGGRTKGDKWHIGRIGGNLWWKEKGRQEWPRAAMTVRLSVQLTGDRNAFPTTLSFHLSTSLRSMLVVEEPWCYCIILQLVRIDQNIFCSKIMFWTLTFNMTILMMKNINLGSA